MMMNKETLFYYTLILVDTGDSFHVICMEETHLFYLVTEHSSWLWVMLTVPI